MEEEATQPSTQAIEPKNYDPIPVDPQVLMILQPASPAANTAVLHLAERYPQLIKQNFQSQLPDICIRWTVPPKNAELGYTFGRNPIKCDVPLGQQSASRRVSNLHFRIFLNESSIIMVEDMSTNGTWVDNVALGAPRAHDPVPHTKPSRRRVLANGSMIWLALGPVEDELKFVVVMEDTNLAGWRKVCGTTMPRPMAPPAQIEVDPFELPPCWNGKDGVFKADPGLIGKGAFAVVKKITRRDTGEPFAIKVILKRAFASSDEAGKKNGENRKLGVMKEVQIMQQLSHPNIIQFFECKETKRQLHIRMEFIEHGDLADYMKKYGPLKESVMQDVTRQLILALEYVHKLGISHRDIKPENILIKSLSPMVVKLADFGLAKMISNDESFLKTFCGTMLYLAPEVFPAVPLGARGPRTKNQTRRYNHSCDMWSLGCVIYYMLTNVPPFQGENQDQIQGRITAGTFDKQRLRDSRISVNGINFLDRLLHVNPEKRMMEREAKRHPWIVHESLVSSSMAVDYPIAEVSEDEEEPELKGEKLQEVLENVEEWEEVKNEIEEVLAHDFAKLGSQDVPQVGCDVQLPVPDHAVADADGDIEIENSQEQHNRLQRENQYSYQTVTEKRRPNTFLRPQAKSPLIQEPHLLSPSPSPHASSFEGDDDEEAFAHGLSMYADPSMKEAPDMPNMSDQGSSGVLGDAAYEEVAMSGDFNDMQHSHSQAESVSSSRGQNFRFDNMMSHGPSFAPTAGRGSLPNRRRTPGFDNGKSLGGVRTMVNNFQFEASDSTVLHKKGSGMLSIDDRVTKKKSQSSTSLFKNAVDAMTAVASGVDGEHDDGNQDKSKTRQQGQIPQQSNSKNHQEKKIPSSSGSSIGESSDGSGGSRVMELVEEDGTLVSRPVWGRLIPCEDSLPHKVIILSQELVSYGRSSSCSCTVTDTRVSKQHFAVTLLMPNAKPDSKEKLNFIPSDEMCAWAKINGTNGVFVNGVRYFTGEIIRVFDEDKFIVFKDRTEVLSFTLEMLIGKKNRTEEDYIWEREYATTRVTKNFGRSKKTDQTMSGV